MFSFPEPPPPQELRESCAACGSTTAIPVYATSKVQYFRCVSCRAIIAFENERHQP